MGIKDLYKLFTKCTGVSIDSRNVKAGDLFVALKGSRVDGNTFCKAALDNGAKLVIMDNESLFFNDPRIVLVQDSLKTLQKLATHHRATFNFPVLGITGSNGKTTTKELIFSVLSKKYNAFATPGNYNNHLGVPLTILSTPAECNFLIVEMGANHIGEIEALCKIADPDFGLITNIGRAHIEGFGSIEGVKIGKTELYRHLMKKDSVIFFNLEDPKLSDCLENYNNKVPYEPSKLFKVLNNYPYLKLMSPIGEISTHLYGDYNLPNLAVAYEIGRYFNVDPDLIIEGISQYNPTNNRSQFIKKGDSYFILDAYNANPSSVVTSIESFSKISYPNKLIILGDMLELGEFEEAGHKEVLDKLVYYGQSKVILVGEAFSKFKELYPYDFFKTRDEAKDFIKSIDLKGKLILLKASRGIALEKVIEEIVYEI